MIDLAIGPTIPVVEDDITQLRSAGSAVGYVEFDELGVAGLLHRVLEEVVNATRFASAAETEGLHPAG